MIIESISLKNFQCYYGEHEDNMFSFKDGLNLIIGNNGSGKSKLYDAFYWVLNDEIFQSETRNLVPTSLYKHKIISDKAKAEANMALTTEVILTVSSAADIKYRLTRSINVLKTGENEWENDDRSVLKIDKMENYRWSPVSASHHETIINRIIPPHMKKYMWFQGEEVDGLLEFGNQDTLTNVINLLSDIRHFDGLRELASSGHEKASSDLRRAKSRQSRDEGKSSEIDRTIVGLKIKIDEITNRINGAKENIARSDEYIEGLMAEVEDAREVQSKKDELNKLKSSLEIKKTKLDEMYHSIHDNVFLNHWVLSGTDSSFDEFTSKYDQYFSLHTHQIGISKGTDIHLPLNVPEPIHVNKMLDDERCFVCGRDAHKGSAEYDCIQSLLSRDGKSETEPFVNDCSAFFQRIYSSGLGINDSIVSIDDSILKFINKLRDIKKKISEINSNINDVEGRYGKLLEGSGSENIVRSYNQHKRSSEEFQLQIKRDEQEYLDITKKLAENKSNLDKLVVGSLDAVKVRANDLYKALDDIATKSRSIIFHGLIQDLEGQANLFFEKMTENNESITGKILLHESAPGHFIPKLVDSDDLEMHNPNDSNIVLVKLSIIMAIIRSRGKFADNFTFISDSPTSKMYKEYSQGFYDTISRNFKQSIITTYDFSDSNNWSELKKFNIGSAYFLKSKYDSEDRADRSSISISITEIV